MEKELTTIEKFQEFLNYFEGFEKKSRDLLSQSKTNLGLKMWLYRELKDEFCMRIYQYKSLIQREEVTTESQSIRQEITNSLKEIRSLIIEICNLPTPELE
jgi:hypothetical protein